MLKSFFVGILFFILPVSLMAHGDAPSTHSEKAVKQAPSRFAATKPATLEPFLIQTILDGDRVPADVILVRCNFTESTPCRGVSISVSDTDGKRVLTGHSGTDGWVGFQGLSKDTEYKLKIESAKYAGELPARSGEIQRLSAARVESKGSN
jgi:hypothetical protein